MKLLILFTKNVTSPDATGLRHRSDASKPIECSESRSGLPFSTALLPGCGPWKYSSSSAGLREARATLNASDIGSVGVSTRPNEPEKFVKSVFGSSAFGLNVARSTRPPNCSCTSEDALTSSYKYAAYPF